MKIEQKSKIEASAEDVYSWHARKSAFARLMPPWERVSVLEMGQGLDVGRRTVLEMPLPWGRRLWVGEHTKHRQDRFFEDTQVEGPFKKWVHTHSFDPVEGGGSRLTDSVECSLPFGIFGKVFGSGFVRRKVEKGFAYRHELVRDDLKLYRKYKDRPRLKVLVAGGSGFIGKELCYLLETQGHEVFVLTRHPKTESDIGWDPKKETIAFQANSHFDAVFNLVGEDLFSKKWTEANKRSFWDSRVKSTRFLVQSLRLLDTPPKVFLSGSAVGLYGNQGDVLVDESRLPGTGFLADLCAAWESEALGAESFVDRVALLRTGIVIDPRGGALKQMHRPFKMGVGGPLGSGRQWMPWIALEDWLYAAYEIMMSADGAGPFNLVSNQPSRNQDFSRDFAAALKRPCLFRVPEFALKMLFGEMAEETLLTSQRIVPQRLESELGFQFRYSEARDALCFML